MKFPYFINPFDFSNCSLSLIVKKIQFANTRREEGLVAKCGEKRGKEWEKGQMERTEQHGLMSEGRLSWYLLTSSSDISYYLLLIVFRLKISTLTFDDAGLYMCTGENPFGETSVTGALAVLPSRLFNLFQGQINVLGTPYNIFSTTVNVIFPHGCQE